MAIALSAHTLRVQLGVYSLSACWRLELGYDIPSRYLALAGTPVNYYSIMCMHSTLMLQRVNRATYQVGLPVCIVHKQQRTVLHMLLLMDKLPQLGAAVEIPHLQFTGVASSQQATLLQTSRMVRITS